MDEKYDVFLVITPANNNSFEAMAGAVVEFMGISREALSWNDAVNLANDVVETANEQLL